MPAARALPIRSRRRRVRWWAWTIAGVLALAFLVHWFGGGQRTRASAERARVANHLAALVQTARVYEHDFGTTPTAARILALAPRESAALFADGAGCSPTTNAAPLVLYQRKPNRAVRFGEPWGGLGEFAERDIPASRFVLHADYTLHQLDESEFRARYALPP